MAKIKVNAPCPCGSGKKYKKCCRNLSPLDEKLIQNILETRHKQLIAEHGLGREVISFVQNGKRYVLVGDKKGLVGEWDNFSEFLYSYIDSVFSKEWFANEEQKTIEQRHPLAQWLASTKERHMAELKRNGGKAAIIESSGANYALLRLAYGLYLLAHNNELQQLLIKRLKDPTSFHGAFHEVVVASILIACGFVLELENETDNTTSHCEFNATFKDTGEQFSIEVKGKAENNTKMFPVLLKALHKKALYKRIIFIATNVSDLREHRDDIAKQINEAEGSLTINNGQPAPPAYLFIYNNAYLQSPENTKYNRAVMLKGFKIPDFTNNKPSTLRDDFKTIQKHSTLFKLFKYMNHLPHIPISFDGEIAEFAVDPALRNKRLVIGGSYILDNGKVGTLESAAVDIKDKSALCVFNVAGSRLVYAAQLSDQEVSAYKRSPNTFLGVEAPVAIQVGNKMELFEFFYKAYKDRPREELLSMLQKHPNIGEIESEPTSEMLLHLCESLVIQDYVNKYSMPVHTDKATD